MSLRLMPSASNPLPPLATAADELALVHAVARRERAALERLYRSYHPRLVRFLSRHTRRDDLAEEVINDCFWTIWQRAGDFRGESRVSTWVFGIAYRLMLKALRDRGDEPVTEVDGDAMGGLDLDAERELSDWLGKGLAQLPAEQRTALELAYGQGWGMEDIAQIMGCSVSAVKSRLFHARTRLRHLLPELAQPGQAA